MKKDIWEDEKDRCQGVWMMWERDGEINMVKEYYTHNQLSNQANPLRCSINAC